MQRSARRALVLLVSGVLAVGVIEGVDYWKKRPLHASCDDGDDCRSGHCAGASTRDGYISVMVEGSGRCVSACAHDSDCAPSEVCTSVSKSLGPFVTGATSGGCLAR